ncbi:MAG: hypothetical protein ABJF10_08650 [Chthoniobacter sp.]
MKPLAPLSVSLCLFVTCLLAASPESRAEDLAALPDATALPRPAPWSILGEWTVSHPDWTGTMTLTADGTFSRTQDHDSGHWTLTALQDRVLLVLAWDHWPAETVTMITPDEFSGKVRGQAQEGEMTLHRVRGPAAGPAAYETRTWRQGEPPVRLIRKEEGFCALTSVTGSFQGGGEIVKVYVADDGFWYLGGESQQEGVAAECIIVRYRGQQ